MINVIFVFYSAKEVSRGDHEVWNCQGNAVGIVTSEDVGMDVKFVYDHVFPAGFSNQGVYDTIASSIVKSSLDGINGTIFAYGVTSSGKTHTMMGDDITPGIVPHAIAEVFHLVDKMSKRKEYTIKLSMLEIYNEIVNDLLDPNNANLRLREDPRKGVTVEGTREERLKSADHALHVVAMGNEHRKISATAFNEGSSRSHTIIRLSIEANDRPEFAKNPNERIGRTFSYLTMVDLAGSESAKAEINRSQRMEGSFINKSLLTLGTVISKLSEGGAVHIPFRDSKLTRILSNSLTGNGARIAVVCTITPASTQAEETHNTLKFASRAKKIAIEAKRNEILEQSTLIARYQQELELLRRQLEHYKNAGPVRGADALGGASDVEVLTLREKFEEEHMAVVELEKEKESLTSHVDRLTQCVLDSNFALTFLEKRLRDHLAYSPEKDSIDEECGVLRRQVSALVEEIRDRDRVLQQLANDGKDLLTSMEEDVALQVMMAEREYMQAQVQDIEGRNHALAAAVEKMRRRTAIAEGIDPLSIDVEAIIRGKDDGVIGSNTAAETEEINTASIPLRHGDTEAMRKTVMKLQERVSAALDKIVQDELKKKEKEKQREETKQALLSQNVRINDKLADVISENKTLKEELARVEKLNEQLTGNSVDHLTDRELFQLMMKMKEAVDRVRMTVTVRKIELKDRNLNEAAISFSTIEEREAKGMMTQEQMETAIAGLHQYISRRA